MLETTLRRKLIDVCWFGILQTVLQIHNSGQQQYTVGTVHSKKRLKIATAKTIKLESILLTLTRNQKVIFFL